MRLRAYFGRVIIAIDQLFNTVVGGEPDETYSSRAGRQKAHGATTGKVVCAVLDKLQHEHCEMSVEEVDAPHHIGKTIHELPRGRPRRSNDSKTTSLGLVAGHQHRCRSNVGPGGRPCHRLRTGATACAVELRVDVR